MSEHDRIAGWDGAYVLGALAPAERAAYELHLAGCRACQDAVAELASLPGLLARVDQGAIDALDALDTDEAPPADLERRLMAAARPAWWRRTSTRAALALAAAAAVVAAVVLPLSLGGHDPAGSVQLSLHSAGGPSRLSAQVALASEEWGTRVDMTCRYAAGGGYGHRSYALYVVDDSGQTEQVSRWSSGPDEVAHTTGSTDIRLGQIARVELRDVASGRLLLSSIAG